MNKKGTSLALALSLCLTMLPTTAWAAEPAAQSEGTGVVQQEETSEAVAEVSGEGVGGQYATLEDAFAEAAKCSIGHATITLLSNVTLTEDVTVPSSKSTILNVGEYAVTGAGNIQVEEYGYLSIHGKGTIHCPVCVGPQARFWAEWSEWSGTVDTLVVSSEVDSCDVGGGTYKTISSMDNPWELVKILDDCAFRGEDENYVRCDTVVTKDSPVQNVTATACYHTPIDGANGHCDYCNEDMLARIGEQGYYRLWDGTQENSAMNQVKSGQTVTLLRDQGEVKARPDTDYTFDLNGKTVSSLIIEKGQPKIADSVGTGSIGTLTIANDLTIVDLLPEGEKFLINGRRMYKEGLASITDKTISDLRLAPPAVQSVEITTDKETYYAGDAIHLTANVTKAEGVPEGEPVTYQWYSVSYDGTATPLSAMTGPTMATLDAHWGTHTYRCAATCEGHTTNSPDLKVKVNQVDLSQGTITIDQDTNFVFKPDSENSGAGEIQSIYPKNITVTCNGRKLKYAQTEAGSDYTLSGLSGANAGEYTLTVKGRDNYTGTLTKTWTIAPMTLRSLGLPPEISKVYDGTTAAPDDLTESKGYFTYGDGNSLRLANNTDFTFSAEYDSSEAGTDKVLFAHVKLLNENYTFENGAKEKDFTYNRLKSYSVTPATAPETDPIQLLITNNHAATYTIDLAAHLPQLEAPRTYGTVTYDPSFSVAYGYLGGTHKLENGVLTLDVLANDTDLTGNMGKVTVKVQSTNYEPFELIINVEATNKLVPTGEPTLTPAMLTYGQTLSAITLSGTMQADGKDVPGTFAWVQPDVTPDVGPYAAAWTFTPSDTATYASVEGVTNVTVAKATPTGAPKYTPITASGKTLADTKLTVEGADFSVSGTVAWDLPADTAVAANTAYAWTFTPDDTTHYNTLTGSITLYSVSHSGGGGGGSSSGKNTTTTNPNGTTTKTETRSDGTTVSTTTDSTGTVRDTEVKLSDQTVTDAKKNDGSVTLPATAAPAQDSADAPTISVKLPGGQTDVKVTIPVTNPTPGTVAVRVNPDGTEESIKEAALTDDGLTLTLTGDTTLKVLDNTKYFTDTKDHWAADAISFVTARDLFQGTGKGQFTPDASMTRAMLWTVLARVNNADRTAGSNWYTPGQTWAKQAGISDGRSPNAPVTREQLATMLWRAAGSPQAQADLSKFTDAPALAPYAQNAMDWAVSQGLIQGTGSNTLSPQTPATRAQLAAILAAYLSK